MKKWAYYNEIDPYCCEWLRNLMRAGHIADGEIDSRSIVDVRPDDVRDFARCHYFAGIAGWDLALRLAGWPDDLPVWTGSCPCQPFSAAGRRAGFDDDRHLWPEMFRLVAERRPAVVFGEQVASRDGLAWLDLVSADLEGSGYAFGAADLCAAGVGAPHIRQRLWWVGILADDAGDGRQQGRRPVEERTGSRHHSADGLLAHSLGPRLEGRDARPLGHEREAAERGGAAGGVDDAAVYGAGPGLRAGDAGDDGRRPELGRSGPWDRLDWLPCRDGKTRPTQPGLFPLVDGLSFKLGSGGALEGKSRVGMLRGAGNAISPPPATAFILSVKAALRRSTPAAAPGAAPDDGAGT